ncbi:hypothetical protein C0J52_13435 [Blattella germanica]|nr:hypothetical protein C0J52_13435 [Blattella germanica]
MAGVLESVREEDFVQYYLFPNGFEDVINANEEREQRMQVALSHVESIVRKYAHNYIWHRDPFSINPINIPPLSLSSQEDDKGPLPIHLYGSTHYGDNIEDEWFIVFLLLQMTKEIDGLVARKCILKAAEYLPDWANPETCEQRVYLFQGAVHIVPLEGEAQEDIISMSEAIEQVRSQPHKTKASQEIQNTIQAKIEGKIADLLHRTNAYVPVGVAALLKEKPHLIAPAVTAFCNRDPIDMKACGFEILVAQARPSTRDKQVENSMELDCDRGWCQYLNSLKKTGYFKDLLEGSKDYQSLVTKAQEFYIKHRDSIHCEPSIGQQVLNLLSSIEYDIDEFKKAEATLPPPDDEKWLEVHPKDLDAMLEERYGHKKFVSTNSNSNPSNISSQLVQFLDHVSGLEGAEFPSIREDETRTESPPVRPKRGIKKGKKKGVSFAAEALKSSSGETSSRSSENKINFDQEAFSCAVQNILDFVIPEDSWDLESDGSDEIFQNKHIHNKIYEYSRIQNSSENRSIKLFNHLHYNVKNLALLKYRGTIKAWLLRNPLYKINEFFDLCNIANAIHMVHAKRTGMEDSFEDIEAFEPVDVDLNALKNIIQSYEAQIGGAGPATNLLGPMGIRLESESSTTDSMNPEV